MTQCAVIGSIHRHGNLGSGVKTGLFNSIESILGAMLELMNQSNGLIVYDVTVVASSFDWREKASEFKFEQPKVQSCRQTFSVRKLCTTEVLTIIGFCLTLQETTELRIEGKFGVENDHRSECLIVFQVLPVISSEPDTTTYCHFSMIMSSDANPIGHGMIIHEAWRVAETLGFLIERGLSFKICSYRRFKTSPEEALEHLLMVVHEPSAIYDEVHQNVEPVSSASFIPTARNILGGEKFASMVIKGEMGIPVIIRISKLPVFSGSF